MLRKLRLDRLRARIFPKPVSAMSPEDVLMGQARLGMSLEQARESELYKYLTVRALAEHDEAIEMLLSADPTNVSQIVMLQGKAKRLGDMLTWVDDAIQRGHAAHMTLTRQEHGDE